MKYNQRFCILSLLLFFKFLLICKSTAGQEKGKVFFQTRLLDEQFNPIEGATIKNLVSNAMTSSNSGGFFAIPAEVNDSLLISGLGYELKKIYVSKIPLPFVHLKQVVFSLKQVDVYEFKNWESFKKEFIETEVPGEKVNVTGLPAGKASQKPIPLRSNTFESKPGVLHFINSPFSSLAYYTNKKEKSKRKVWRMMILENNQSEYWSAMHRDSLKSWTNIPDSLIDDFIVFCNLEIEDKQQFDVYYYKEMLTELYPLFIEKRKEH